MRFRKWNNAIEECIVIFKIRFNFPIQHSSCLTCRCPPPSTLLLHPPRHVSGPQVTMCLKIPAILTAVKHASVWFDVAHIYTFPPPPPCCPPSLPRPTPLSIANFALSSERHDTGPCSGSPPSPACHVVSEVYCRWLFGHVMSSNFGCFIEMALSSSIASDEHRAPGPSKKCCWRSRARRMRPEKESEGGEREKSGAEGNQQGRREGQSNTMRGYDKEGIDASSD